MPIIYIYFNNATKLPSFLSLEKINTPLQYKEIDLVDLGIEDGGFNIARFKWDGDYDTGKLVDLFKEKKAIVTEEEIDNKYYGIFFRKYPLEQTLFNIIKYSTFNRDGIPMQEFLIKILNKKETEIEFFKNSDNHIFESTSDQEKRIQNSFRV